MPRGGGEVQLYYSLASTLDGDWWLTPRSNNIIRTQCTRGGGVAGGLGADFGRLRKILPSPGLDPRTVQPVANLCTD